MENNKKDIIEELKTLNAKKLIAFKEPSENYFNALESNINIEIDKLERKSIKPFLISFSIAASLVLFIGFYFSINTINQSFSWQEINAEEIDTYVFENIEEFSTEEIASVSNQYEFSFLESISISETELEDYLLNETNDETEFINF